MFSFENLTWGVPMVVGILLVGLATYRLAHHNITTRFKAVVYFAWMIICVYYAVMIYNAWDLNPDENAITVVVLAGLAVIFMHKWAFLNPSSEDKKRRRMATPQTVTFTGVRDVHPSHQVPGFLRDEGTHAHGKNPRIDG